MSDWWTYGVVAILVYCIWQTIRDFRSKNYKMAVIGLVCTGLFIALPIPPVTHAITIDLPAPSH